MAEQEKEQQKSGPQNPLPGLRPEDQGIQDRYSYQGLRGDDLDEEANTAPDGYGVQYQYGDADQQDPYSNLVDEDPGSTPGGEGLQDPEQILYGLAEPLAREGDESRQGSNKDRYGTRRSQDQQGYQQ